MATQFPRFIRLSLIGILTLLIVLLLPNSAIYAANDTGSTTNWSQLGFNASHTFYNPKETTISTSNVSQLTMKWQNSVSGGTPVEVNNVLYTFSPSDGNEYAFNAISGQQVWSVHLEKPLQSYSVSSNAVITNTVYVSGEKALYALNASTGATIWKFGPKSYNQSDPVAANGVVYIHGFSHTHDLPELFALKAATGKVIRQYLGILETPTYINGILYADAIGKNQTGYASAIDAKTGAYLWQTSVPSGFAAPSVVNGMVYFSTGDSQCKSGIVFALNAQTGTIVWQQSIGQIKYCYTLNGPSVANNDVYASVATSSSTTFYAFNAMTGTQIWKSSTTASTPNRLVAANGVLYSLGSDLSAFNAGTGVQLSTISTQSTIDSSTAPTVVNGMIFVMFDSGLNAFGL
ncbi:MAG: PQQ-binding-like beta-propeller repeat protein [Ktedonobacteraceae bacterium]